VGKALAVNWTVITSIAAVAAVVVAALQWMTAQTKLALAIHGARYAIYQDLRDVVLGFSQNRRMRREMERPIRIHYEAPRPPPFQTSALRRQYGSSRTSRPTCSGTQRKK
jgi:hypothetical protein